MSYYLKRAVRIENLTQNPRFPGKILIEGSRGENVKTMQKYLNEMRRVFYPQLPLLEEDGVFGKRTKQVVKEFQILSDVIVDGKIGPVTWNTIVSKYNSIPDHKHGEIPGDAVRALQGNDNARTFRASAGDNPAPKFQTGNNTDAVRSFQPRDDDNAAREDNDDTVRVVHQPKSIDVAVRDFQTEDEDDTVRVYRPKSIDVAVRDLKTEDTDDTIRVYQPKSGGAAREVGVEDTGDAGGSKSVNNPGEMRPGTVPSPGPLLRFGNSGSDVKLMQQRLNAVQTFYTAINKLKEDGIFGAETNAAVHRFQEQFDLKPDGVVGEKTWGKIIEVSRAVEVKNYMPVSTRYPGFTHQRGSADDNARYIQSYLNHINGANDYGWPVLKVDGIFGERTAEAVAAFQTRYGLEADKIVGRKTWAMMISEFNSAITMHN